MRRISNQPDGTPQEGLPLDKQRVGSLIAGDVEADLVLVRVSDSGGGRIWLISSDTLARLNELYDQAAVHQWETHLPQAPGESRVSGHRLVAMAGDTDRDPDRGRPGMAGRPIPQAALVSLGPLSQA